MDTKLFEVKDFSIGDRVLYRAAVNNPGHYAPGDTVPGTVIAAFPNPDKLTYRIQLDMTYGDQVAARGQPIKLGNIYGGSLTPLP